MKKRTTKSEKTKPATDKSYSGRQKKVLKPKKSEESSESLSSKSFKKSASEKPNFRENKELGFRKNLRKRNTSSEGAPKKDEKKKFSSSKSTSDSLRERKSPRPSFDKKESDENSDGDRKKKFKSLNSKNTLRVSYRKSENPSSADKGRNRRFKSRTGEEESEKSPKRHLKTFKKGPKKETPTYKALSQKSKPGKPAEKKEPEDIRLNRYIANAGICSRREADELISSGLIRVNNEVITEMGYKVKPGDVVKYENKILKREKLVYVLLNKPKDFITTTDDPEERKTVMDLVRNACDERIYPVGRLDRNTTGLLLLTNDGSLAEKLAHPSNNIKKVYQVLLDKPITEQDFQKIKEGVVLEDGKAFVDDLSIVTPDATVLGIEIHIGRNRIVRRIFEHLGYTVNGLDRVIYAGLTKKDLPRGHWRFLTEKEVIHLKHFSS